MRSADRDKRIARLARANENVFDLAALQRAGASRKVAFNLTNHLLWQRPQRGVYVEGAASLTLTQQVRVAIAAAAGAVASHLTAASLYGLDVDKPTRIELTTRWAQQPEVIGVHVYRSRRELRGLRRIEGIPVTSVERTLIDLAAVLGRRDLERAIESALLKRLTTERRIYEAIVREGGRGVRGIRKFVQVMEERPRGRPSRSVLELMVKDVLRDAGLTHFVRNHPVIADGELYEIDAAFVDEWVAIEADGLAFHSTSSQRAKDARRQASLEAAGWTFRRVAWEEIVLRPDEFVADVRALLSRASCR